MKKQKFCHFIHFWAQIALLDPDLYCHTDPDPGNTTQYGSGSWMLNQYESAWIRIRIRNTGYRWFTGFWFLLASIVLTVGGDTNSLLWIWALVLRSRVALMIVQQKVFNCPKNCVSVCIGLNTDPDPAFEVSTVRIRIRIQLSKSIRIRIWIQAFS